MRGGPHLIASHKEYVKVSERCRWWHLFLFYTSEVIEAMSSKKNKIRPLQDRIIVERLAPEEKSSGGIILPDNAQERPQRGRVVAVGKGKVREDGTVTPVDVKEGDEILFGKYSGTEVKVEGAELLIMREDDVLGVVL